MAAGTRGRRLLVAGLAMLAVAVAAYVAEVACHPLHWMLGWYDLGVYRDAGLIARQHPALLYTWELRRGIKFTYTPFAAMVFAAASLLPWPVLAGLMTAVSALALAAMVWLTFGALGWRGAGRVCAAAMVIAVALWAEPVQRALHLGQIELVLVAMIVWDRCLPDDRWWKGAGIGLAAGVKLIPLIFIPYLVLTGKLRQAATAAAAFALTMLAGFAFLPAQSGKWWLTGYFLHVRNVGGAASMVNQSLLALIARADGSLTAAGPLWLAVAVATGILGVTAAAVLHRAGNPVQGWLTCALTGLLVSPISWDHHWVWLAPALVLFADAALRARGAARLAGWAVAGGLAVVFLAWPWLSGPRVLLPHGLLGFFAYPHSGASAFRLHGTEQVGWNLYVIAGMLMCCLALAAAARAWWAWADRKSAAIG